VKRLLFAFALVASATAVLPSRATAQPHPAVSESPETPSSDTLTPDELQDRSKEAMGADRKPDAEHEEWSLRAYGLDGTLETWRVGTDMRSDTVLGGFRSARGTFHGQRWHQNDNGETILDRPEPTQVEKSISETVTRVKEPIDAWLLTTTYESGHVLRSYYDPRTFYLVRTVRTIAGRDTHMIFDDFRTDARGRTRAWRYIGGDDRPGSDYEYRLVRDDIDASPVAQETVAVPKDRRMLVEFPAGSDVVRLPARVVNNRIYVRLDIAGRGLDFLLDSGSSTINIDAAVARELGLEILGRSAQTVAGTYASGRVVVPAVGIGALAMHDVVMHTVPIDQHEKTVRVVGLLGFDFFDAVGLKIDYAGGTVDAYRPGTIVPPPNAVPLEVALNSGAPVAHATFGDASGEDFVVDTGAAFPYVLFQRFVRAHPGASAPDPRDARSQFLDGVGGQIEYRNVTSKRLEFGAFIIDDPAGIEALSSNAFGFDNEDGLIGSDILKLFTVYTDYAAGKLYLGSTPQSEAAGARTARSIR
jgi:hypothetical protein